MYVVFFVFLGLLFSCKYFSYPPPYVLTTTTLLWDISKNLLQGTPIKAYSLIGRGIDPHTYKPPPRAFFSIENADLIIYHGLHLEGKIQDLFHSLEEAKKKIYCATCILPRESLIPVEENLYDPHVWFDLSLWKKVVEGIGEYFKKNFPSYSSSIGENLHSYLERLDKLEKEVLKKVSSLPSSKRILITAHDAFSYFGRAYSFQIRSLQGINTAAEISLTTVDDLAKWIMKRKVRAIFVERSLPKWYLNSLVSLLKERGYSIKLVGSLYTDALGEEGSEGEEYISMFLYNVDTIVSSLKGERI